MMAPPFDAGGVTVIAAVVDVPVTVAIAGAPGGAAGVVIVDPAVRTAPEPTAFVASAEIV